MFDQTAKLKLRTMGQANGSTIEDIITALYTKLSEKWRAAVMLDGGAHGGAHTFPMAALPNVACVIAVEANDETYAQFKKQVEKSPNTSKIELIHGALQDNPDSTHVYFRKSPTHPGRSGINPILQHNKDTTFSEPVAMPATTIDHLMKSVTGRCEFMKLDLEGGEYFALRGASNCLRRDRPVVFFENGTDAPMLNGYQLDDFIKYLESLGYSFYTVFSERMSLATQADFWYAWAAPVELQDEILAIMPELVSSTLARG